MLTLAHSERLSRAYGVIRSVHPYPSHLLTDMYLEILGIERNASKAEIKKAYHKVLNSAHDICCIPCQISQFVPRMNPISHHA